MWNSEWWARTKLISRHSASSVRRAWPRAFAYILLILSFGLFAMVLFPLLFQRLPIVGYMPRIQRLHGTVSQLVAQGGQVRREPAANVTVHVGGFSALTNGAGQYSVVFLARDTSHVPVVFGTDTGTVVREISFGDKEYSSQLDPALP